MKPISTGMIALARRTAFDLMDVVYISEVGHNGHEQFAEPWDALPEVVREMCVAVVTPDMKVFILEERAEADAREGWGDE